MKPVEHVPEGITSAHFARAVNARCPNWTAPGLWFLIIVVVADRTAFQNAAENDRGVRICQPRPGDPGMEGFLQSLSCNSPSDCAGTTFGNLCDGSHPTLTRALNPTSPESRLATVQRFRDHGPYAASQVRPESGGMMLAP